MLWLSWKSKELAYPQAQGGQQMWREEALTPQEVLGGGNQALLRPQGSLPIYSMGPPPACTGLCLLCLPKGVGLFLPSCF